MKVIMKEFLWRFQIDIQKEECETNLMNIQK